MKSMKALLAAAGVAAAQASWSNVYIGATIGQAEYKDGCSGLGEAAASAGATEGSA